MKHLSRLSFPIPTYQHIPKDTLGLTVTSPLQIYRNLVASNIISADPNQHRAAIVIQGVYDRLLDYKPERYTDLKRRLDAVTNSLRALEDAHKKTSQNGNGGGGGGLQRPKTTWRDSPYLPTSLQSPQAQSKALIRTFSRDEELLNISSPRGLLLSGNVGCGKSMLTDILAESLPVESKRRVHFDTFMLGVYGMLEDFRIKNSYGRHDRDIGEGYSILHVAKEMVDKSTVLILDEFQMPDKASGKILKSLLNAFFMMGGVLIATSNRLPETLVSAEWRKKEEFGVFEEVLKRRCEVWDMKGGVDWRRRGGEGRIVQVPANSVGLEVGRVVEVPKFYFLEEGDMQEAWDDAVEGAANGAENRWTERGLVVYGREVVLKRTRNDAALFDFDELCTELLGPADYITIASNFSTIIIDKIPVLTSKSHRHEARRFITLLDAIYECRCKLLIRAEVPIENLFFPDAAEKSANSQEEDSIHLEAFAEAHQDLTVPFRPNVSLYEQLPEDPNDPLTWKRKRYTVADQDSDFRGKVDFTSVKKYTGEDEKFSFKRAVSRVWEVCGERWWDALSQSEKESPAARRVTHSPMSRTLRRWEGGITEADTKISHPSNDPDTPTARLRPDAPQFTPVHIWGVIDSWGKRAGRWGKGVNAYKDGDTRDKSSDTRGEK
ncbi:hypothetical protein TWF718_008622 [Orbilia javanica]|uniref:AAA+ ATPase domain-containing protein n=1 Tax=Orbilia javanica TaxID=47235 RepID=A0AAN8RFJ5_9PEZI